MPLFLFSFLPFIGMLFVVVYANRVEPLIFGLPYFLFWYMLMVVLTPIILLIVYKFHPANKEEEVE